VFVQNLDATPVISPYPRERNDYEYFDNRSIGDGKVGPDNQTPQRTCAIYSSVGVLHREGKFFPRKLRLYRDFDV